MLAVHQLHSVIADMLDALDVDMNFHINPDSSKFYEVLPLMDLGKPDPSGYYVLVFHKDILDKIKSINGVFIEEYGDTVIVRLKSRAIAKMLLRKYHRYLVIS